MLPAWRESTVYSDVERAALALTEEVTLIADGHVPPDVEAAAREHLDDTDVRRAGVHDRHDQRLEPPRHHGPLAGRQVPAEANGDDGLIVSRHRSRR